MAKWTIVIEGLRDVPAVDERISLASEIEMVLAESVQTAVALTQEADLAAELSKIAGEAARVTRIRVYLDGGISLRELDDACRSLIQSVTDALDADTASQAS